MFSLFLVKPFGLTCLVWCTFLQLWSYTWEVSEAGSFFNGKDQGLHRGFCPCCCPWPSGKCWLQLSLLFLTVTRTYYWYQEGDGILIFILSACLVLFQACLAALNETVGCDYGCCSWQTFENLESFLFTH